MVKTIANKIYKVLKRNANYYQNKNKIWVSVFTYNSLHRFPPSARNKTIVFFNGRKIRFSSPFWFLHSIDEIFIQEVYKFCSEKESPYIIDCGSNIGLSVIYFKTLFSKARVVAFEADPTVFDELRNNIGEYGYNDVSLVNAAVWTDNTTITFKSEGSVGGMINPTGTSETNDVQVPAIRLKEYLEEEIDFLKIDIEGAEYLVLKDCKALLSNVRNLFIEYHEEKLDAQKLHEILQWLDHAGFKYYIKEAWNNMTNPFTKKYNDHFHSQLNIFCFRP
jgi:FkbM family methyltransferase